MTAGGAPSSAAPPEIRLVRFVLSGPAALKAYERALDDVHPG
jgi:hypothetical protein